MCGIAGFYSPQAPLDPGIARTLGVMLGSMAHRGPDAEGIWIDERGRCALGHRRLSIIDTSDAGRQPMASTDLRWMITYNGELYNYRDLSPQVATAGLPPIGRTDTEVLANAVALWGRDALPKLDGMFAFACFDTLSGELLLARDPFGEKPLYYMELEGGGLAFASELQALEKIPGFDPAVSTDAVGELLMFQYIGAPRTIYRSVKKLPPGHWLRIGPDTPLAVGRYFRFAPGEAGFTGRSMADLADELEAILVRSIDRRMIADVPLGAFLSGGVDSSTVCALVRHKLGRPLQTFSIGFKGAAESEHEAARTFARHLGTEHFDQIVAPSASDFLKRIGGLLDEPNADSSCLPTYLLSEFARRRVTVAISGDGGDEMLGGYGRYFTTLDEEAAGAGSAWRPGQAYYSDKILVFTEPLVRELMGAVPAGLAGHLAELRAGVDRADVPLACRLRRTDVEHYMPGAVLAKVDRMSMQHALEVRTPFLNVELARFAERLPPSMLYQNGKGKPLLRELAYRYLPREMIDAPKQGFGLPMSRWGRKELLSAARDLLETDDSRLRAALGPQTIKWFMDRQRARDGFATYQVWGLAVLESWLRHHPAQTSQLESAILELRSRSGITPGRGQRLDVLHVGDKLFAAFERGASGVEGPPSESVQPVEERPDLVKLLIRFYLVNPERSYDPAWQQEASRSKEIDLPGWGELLGAVPVDRREALRGATLLFPDPEAVRKLNMFELRKLQRLGILQIAFSDPYRYDWPLFQLELRAPSTWRRWLNAVRLLPHCLGYIRLRGRWRAYLLKRFKGPRHGQYVSRQLPRLRMAEDAELSHRFMLFEGLRQLPPIPASHTDIASLGGGRYSVWAQRAVYSCTSTWRLLTRPYWLVERSPASERYLEFVPKVAYADAVDLDPFYRSVAHLIANDGGARADPAELRPGDPVVLVTHALPPGGAERQWCYLAQTLKALGYQVSFVVTAPMKGENAHYLPLLRESGIRVLELGAQPIAEFLDGIPRGGAAAELIAPTRNPFGATLGLLASLLNAIRPKVVFAQLDAINLLAGLAGIVAGVPRTVLSFRNYNPSHFPYLNVPWFLPLYRELSKSSRIVLSGNSREGNRDYAQWIGTPEARVAWTPNAIDPVENSNREGASRDALRAELGLRADSRIILGVFRLSDEKRPSLFVEVCERATRDVPGACALIAGIGPAAPALQQLIREKGIEDRVRLLGRRDDVGALMQISSLLLLTSSHEGMPNVVLEAQQHGLPVIATRVGGVPDCVAHGQTGFVVAPDDVDELVKRCTTLLTDPGLAAEMGRRGVARMRTEFSKAAMAQRFLALVDPEAGKGAAADASNNVLL